MAKAQIILGEVGVGKPDSIHIVPPMTGASAPWGTASAHSEFTDSGTTYSAWKAAANSSSLWYTPAKNEAYTDYYWEYAFENSARCVVTEFKVTAISYNQTSSSVYYDMQLVGWNGNEWVELSEVTRIVGVSLSTWAEMDFTIKNMPYVNKIRVICKGTNGASMHVSGKEVFVMKQAVIKGYQMNAGGSELL